MEKQELYDMCKSIIDLNKERYIGVKIDFGHESVEMI